MTMRSNMFALVWALLVLGRSKGQEACGPYYTPEPVSGVDFGCMNYSRFVVDEAFKIPESSSLIGVYEMMIRFPLLSGFKTKVHVDHLTIDGKDSSLVAGDFTGIEPDILEVVNVSDLVLELKMAPKEIRISDSLLKTINGISGKNLKTIKMKNNPELRASNSKGQKNWIKCSLIQIPPWTSKNLSLTWKM